jgi:hypothetical protein
MTELQAQLYMATQAVKYMYQLQKNQSPTHTNQSPTSTSELTDENNLRDG